MIPVDKIRNDVNLDSMLRFLEWENPSSKAPSNESLEILGQLVMEDVISSSECTVGDVHVKFSVDHQCNRKLPDNLKKEFYFGVPSRDDDFLVLTATFRWNPDGPGTAAPELREVPVYDGQSFMELWAVWKGWMSAGSSLMADLACYARDKLEEEKSNDA